VSTVELVVVREDDKPVLANLLQFYCYEFSAVRQYEVTEHGLFVYRYLDHYFVEPDRNAYFVRCDDALAGFALSRMLDTGEREMSEFFVMRKHRRTGMGRSAAELLFAKHPGRWLVAFDDDNHDATSFWPSVVRAVAVGAVHEESVGPPEVQFPKTVLRFATE
jgi:predicted acetyltransferase